MWKISKYGNTFIPGTDTGRDGILMDCFSSQVTPEFGDNIIKEWLKMSVKLSLMNLVHIPKK